MGALGAHWVPELAGWLAGWLRQGLRQGQGLSKVVNDARWLGAIMAPLRRHGAISGALAPLGRHGAMVGASGAMVGASGAISGAINGSSAISGAMAPWRH